MKIKSLYIEKFGGIKDKKVDLNDKINIIYAQNEYGKTTIAEFLKMMLYGQGKSPISIRDNERKRFMPWDDKTMGGEITVENDGNLYIISRSFGKKKSDDKISVVNGVTGAEVPQLCIDSPGDILLGVGREGFEKSLYIRQLSTKIISDKDDEILKMLVNLAQSGDDGVSYAKAISVLDATIKEINGTRPKGKIPQIRERISELYSHKVLAQNSQIQKENYKTRLKNLEQESENLKSKTFDKSIIQKCKNLYATVQSEIKSQENEYLKQTKDKKRGLLIQLIVAMVITVVLCFAFLPIAPVTLAWAVYCVVKMRKSTPEFIFTSQSLDELYEILKIDSFDLIEKQMYKMEKDMESLQNQNTLQMLEIAQQIGDLKSKIESIAVVSAENISDEIAILEDKIEEYNEMINDLNNAKTSLNFAFEQLQKGFGAKLNEKTSQILRRISAEKYSEVLVDENYNMMVRLAENNKLHDAQFLSNGAYDQIYLSLRFAIISLLFEDVPVILDDAFVQYDDTRLENAIKYIQALENQVIIFTCHKREQELVL